MVLFIRRQSLQVVGKAGPGVAPAYEQFLFLIYRWYVPVVYIITSLAIERFHQSCITAGDGSNYSVEGRTHGMVL